MSTRFWATQSSLKAHTNYFTKRIQKAREREPDQRVDPPIEPSSICHSYQGICTIDESSAFNHINLSIHPAVSLNYRHQSFPSIIAPIFPVFTRHHWQSCHMKPLDLFDMSRKPHRSRCLVSALLRASQLTDMSILTAISECHVSLHKS